jgi:hypothetical protein
METIYNILDIDTKSLSHDELIREIENIKNELKDSIKKRREKNHQHYNSGNLAEKRKAKTIANSKTAIRKFWKDRKEKKELILNHIDKLRNIDKLTFSNKPATGRKSAYEKNKELIFSMLKEGKSYQTVVDRIGYGSKQSLFNYVKNQKR